MLFTPARHEAITSGRFSEAAARDAIGRIAARATREVDLTDAPSGVYDGAAGVAWALHELAGDGQIERELVDALANAPDLDVEGVWNGVAGVLAVAEHCWPDAARRDRLAELGRASLESPALEPMYGHPGHMLLAAQLYARTGEKRWAALWSAGAERLLREWRRDDALGAWLWTQRLGAEETRYVGAAHGLVGNAHVLLRGGALLSADQRDEVERMAVASLSRLAVVEDGRANWPAVAGGPLAIRGRIRVQWCHGAPGLLTALWDVAPDDAAWDDLLLAAGRLVWEAGPIRDDPGLCHGTAGNAYALLALWRRTGDQHWLDRARAFAQHAAAQVDARAARLGHGCHSLFTGDEGVALCLAACITGDERMPVADRLI